MDTRVLPSRIATSIPRRRLVAGALIALATVQAPLEVQAARATKAHKPVAATRAAASSKPASAAAATTVASAANIANAAGPAATRSPIGADDLYGLPVPDAAASSTEYQLFGTWQGALPKDSGPIGNYTITLKEDGTFRLSAMVRTANAPDTPIEVVNLGRWSASNGIYTTVTTRSADGNALDLSRAAFTSIYAIRSVAPDNFVVQNIASGDTYSLARIATPIASK